MNAQVNNEEVAAVVQPPIIEDVDEAKANDNNEEAALDLKKAAFTTTMDRGLKSVAEGIVDIRKAGIMAIEHAMDHKQPTLLNLWLEGIADAKALKVGGPALWVSKYCPYTVKGIDCTYDPSGNHILDLDAAKMENPFEMGKVEKPIEEFTSAEFITYLTKVVGRYEDGSKTRKAVNDAAASTVTAAKTAIQQLH